jgi:pimeloyl-ACP methyl ester carboxylesterase
VAVRPFAAMTILVCALCGLGAQSAKGRPPTGPYDSFRVYTDSVPTAEIAGWILPAAGRAKGTVFLIHGWNARKDALTGWQWLRDREGWNVVMFDLREHGESSHSAHLSSLGYYEIWDVKAAVDHAQRKGLRRPYVIYGCSLGASVGLRWATMDKRIDGVFAVSPFKNAYLASEQLTDTTLHVDFLPSPFSIHPGFRRMLETVDLPTAVRNRDDLRIWIMVGGRDCFPESDQREILAASHSPDRLKRLVVAPGRDHRNVWNWPGDAQRPSHDEYLRQFLRANQRATSTILAVIYFAVLTTLSLIIVARRRRKNLRLLTSVQEPAAT